MKSLRTLSQVLRDLKTRTPVPSIPCNREDTFLNKTLKYYYVEKGQTDYFVFNNKELTYIHTYTQIE